MAIESSSPLWVPKRSTVVGGGCVAPTDNRTYTDYTLPSGSYLGDTIDWTGVADSTEGVNQWVAAQPNGTNALNHARYIFPPAGTLKMSTAIALGDKSHVTVWGHTAAVTQWLPDTDRLTGFCSYTPGCTISMIENGANAPSRAGFIFGATYNAPGSVFFGHNSDDVRVVGFNIDGNCSTPGIYNAGVEGQGGFEYGNADDCEIAYNKLWNIPGDGIRFRGDDALGTNGWFHHNWIVDSGRMGLVFVEGNGYTCEYNYIERSGYYGIDCEPDDDATFAFRILDNVMIRYNTFGSFGSTGVGGNLAAICDGFHAHAADISILDNSVTGHTYGLYATTDQTRHLRSLIGQNISETTTGVDNRIQRLTISGNRVTHAVSYGAGPVILAGGVDVLTVQNNDSNMSGGSFTDGSAYLVASTSVTSTGNT